LVGYTFLIGIMYGVTGVYYHFFALPGQTPTYTAITYMALSTGQNWFFSTQYLQSAILSSLTPTFITFDMVHHIRIFGLLIYMILLGASTYQTYYCLNP
jgi:hypothetical protein